jgi:hypothetical protein
MIPLSVLRLVSHEAALADNDVGSIIPRKCRSRQSRVGHRRCALYILFAKYHPSPNVPAEFSCFRVYSTHEDLKTMVYASVQFLGLLPHTQTRPGTIKPRPSVRTNEFRFPKEVRHCKQNH